MDTGAKGLVMSYGFLRRNQPTVVGTIGGTMAVWEGDHGNAPAEEWSLLTHSPGQEPWVVGLEELLRLQREAGDADGLAGEVALIEH